MNKMRVGFYVRNSFQVHHFRSLFGNTPNAVWIVKSKSRARAFGILDGEPVAASRFFLRRLMEKRFDVIISQTTPPGRKLFKSSKFVMLQYGYAKESYNFGEWRKQSDLILAYGDYAKERFSKMAPSVAIGNPRWDDWQNPEFHRDSKSRLNAILNPDLKTIVYAPTWGELSSARDWIDYVTALGRNYNVIVKAHHNSVRDGEINPTTFPENVYFLPNEDLFALMTVADLVISDVSGAIFDAVLCSIPVALISPNNLDQSFGKKVDEHSIEIKRRAEFGVIIDSPPDLDLKISEILDGNIIDASQWRTRLFETRITVAQNFQNAIGVFDTRK